ncbi:NAD(P)H-hydrate dehydratase [Salinibacterium sp. G-O1]|uniref:ADP-dependent NAD(P)H-hydrate dehydratase n=1 Tax=Salinibacterium sp. G-O1 TaxID=3046208 RepID=UPI0024B89308|nr:ADP/ATP-dependent (S)-NAD(P)H-hydrate dehydratase [Salinibacterium sp. G-O1]MDJ0334608.1 NAD(P)H-hydrate dehydratase [Salinibacterium sp. G-O1]
MTIAPNYREAMSAYTSWTVQDAAERIAVPATDDDKYSRGVLGVITGSTMYPGAAVIGVEAALRTGVGMVRYLGPERAADLVLQRRPEAVISDGRVQAWLMGSGMDHVERESLPHMVAALAQPVPVVLDGGALDLHSRAGGPVVVTPHFRELARLLGADVSDVAADPSAWARKAADALGVTVLLKGHTTYVAGPGISLSAASAPTWLATAGAGDALAGILGALVATHSREVQDDPTELARLAATAAVVHGLAAERASAGGPLTVLDLAAAVPATIGALLRG